MKIEITKSTLEFLKDYLKNADHQCDWEIGALQPYHKIQNTVTYQYWVCKQIAIRNAFKELKEE